MTDLEMTKLCAQAMGLPIDEQTTATISYRDKWHISIGQSIPGSAYGPLHDDAQAMALVKKFEISIRKIDPDRWDAWIPLLPADGSNADLNRAIVECVAKMASVVEAK